MPGLTGTMAEQQSLTPRAGDSTLTYTEADSIRILISTDNHVGYNERDPDRGDDSWKTFDEVMAIAKDRDVDMVLLAGDLFHENKPSRKAMYQVMRSLREHCFGSKPCELEMLSDSSEHFAGAFNHVNYEDQDINVAIPVFSIHGNHDDPSGEGHLAALDLLAMSGQLNYYGRTPESDNIEIKPVLLQKGRTKLALYGMSNVRDERLFRTFRDGKVRFFQPSAQLGDWFNIMSVHQNHHAYTETSYLPEQFLPSFMDLIIWGHEHECKINPQPNPEKGFKVIQPGSSVATSLVKGEAVPKHVAILTVMGTDFEIEPIRLRTVRPFIVREVALGDYEEMRDLEHTDGSTRITQFLTKFVNEMIEQAHDDWYAAQSEAGIEVEEDDEPPKPLIRLRVDMTPVDGGEYVVENPQRFSSRFSDRVANKTDIVQYHKKRKAAKPVRRQPEMPGDEVMAQITIESVKMDELVKEFLGAQSLTLLPQNRFSDAVGQFVNKDDKHAMEEFISESLKAQQAHLTGGGDVEDDEDIDESRFDDYEAKMDEFRNQQEEAHAKGELRRKRKKGTVKPRPSGWDSDENGHWEDNPLSYYANEEETNGTNNDNDDDDDNASVASGTRPARGRGSRGGRAGRATTGTTRKTATTTKKPPAKASRSKKKEPSEDEEEDEDVIMLDDDDEVEESQGLFVSQTSSRSRTQRAQTPPLKKAPAKAPTRAAVKAPPKSTGSRAPAAPVRQSQLKFGSSQVNGTGTSHTNGTGRMAAPKSPSKSIQISDDEISDDDAFEPPPAAQRSARAAPRR